MSIACGRRTDYLERDCKEKCIEVKPSGKKLMKDDYVKALRKWWLNHYYGSEENIPWSLKFMLSIESPQLCRRIKDLKPEQQQLVWDSKDWIAEEKISCIIKKIAKLLFMKALNKQAVLYNAEFCIV